jgi:preprotein translocase subunit SecD
VAQPTRRNRPARSLATLAVAIVVLYAALMAGTRWGSATMTPGLALDLEGGTQLILTPVAETSGTVTEETINQAIQVIRQRIDASGVSEAEISSQSGGKIVVGLPGNPSQETLDLVRTSAQMEFRPVLEVSYDTATPTPTASADAQTDPTSTDAATDATSADTAATPTPDPTPTGTPTSPSDAAYYVTPAVQAQFDALDCTDQANRTGGENGKADQAFVTCNTEGTAKYILGPVEVEGAQIAKAGSGLQTLTNGQVGTDWVVNLQFTSKGTTEFAAVSERLVNQPSPLNQFGIVLDGLVISAPQMNSVIADGRAEISGTFTRESAATLAQQLNFGSLPISFTVESEERISATLGSEQLSKGLLAGLIGLILVVLYSLVQYRALGLLTVGSLAVAAGLTYGVITLLSWTQGYRLSLAGVAGLIVAIGITADSFIVYFERVRDELRDGRTLGGAVEHGWTRARRTILASDAVNFIAAVVLYSMAAGGVRGFAYTLGLTTLIDLVVVFGFTHPMMQVLARMHFFSGGHPASGLDPASLGVEGVRYVGRGRVERGSAAGQDGPTIAERRAAAKATADDQTEGSL